MKTEIPTKIKLENSDKREIRLERPDEKKCQTILLKEGNKEKTQKLEKDSSTQETKDIIKKK